MNTSPRRLAVGLAAAAAALTLLMAWPVLQRPTTRLFGSEIVGRHADPFIVISQFESPRGLGLYTQPGTDYVGAALAALTGDGVVAHNLLVLASFPLAALFAGLLALALTRSAPAAWLAGLAYAFAPYHVAHAAYHAHGSQTQWLPLYLLALWLCLERFGAGRALLLAAATALVVLSNFYYGLIAAVITPVALIGFWPLARARAGSGSARGLALTALTLTGIAAAGMGWIAAFAPQVFGSAGALAFPRRDLVTYSARWWNYLLPPVGHPVAGGFVAPVWDRAGDGRLEQQLTIGIGLLALAAVAGLAWWRGRTERVAGVPALAVLGIVAFACSLPPGDGAWSLRPSGLIYEALPMFRAYARFGLVVLLATALLAAIGLAVLLERRSRRATWLAAGLVLLATVELAPVPPWRWRDILPTAAHRWLAGREGNLRVLDCVPLRSVPERMGARSFRHPIGWLQRLDDCGDPGFAGRLAAESYTHMLVRRPSPLGEWLAERPPPAGLEPAGEFEDALLFAVRAAPAGVHLSPAEGFSWREYQGQRSYRWMGEGARLLLVNAAGEPLAGALVLELNAFPGPRALAVRLDGRPIAELALSTEPRPYSIDLPELAPGRHVLELETDGPAVVADEVLHNGDQRALAVAVGEWSWRRREGPERP